MTVWCIFDNGWEGSFLQSVWSTKELAEDELLKRNWVDKYHSVEEILVDSGEV